MSTQSGSSQFVAQEVQRPGVVVVGHSIATAHEDVSGHAPGLWQKTATDPRMVGAAPGGPAVKGPPFFAAYYAYASDFAGPYTMLVGVEAADANADRDVDLVRIEIPPGRYAEIVVDTPDPQRIAAAWGFVWNALKGRERRTYAFDYEVHSQTTATLYVGIAPPPA